MPLAQDLVGKGRQLSDAHCHCEILDTIGVRMRTGIPINDSDDKTYALPNIESDSEQTGINSIVPRQVPDYETHPEATWRIMTDDAGRDRR